MEALPSWSPHRKKEMDVKAAGTGGKGYRRELLRERPQRRAQPPDPSASLRRCEGDVLSSG